MSLKKFVVEHDGIVFKFKLYLIGRDGPGILELISLADGSSVSIYLDGRHVKILLIYNKTLKASKHLVNEAARGWLTNEQVASMYMAEDPKGYVPEPNVFTTYRSQIQRAIKKEMTRRYPRRTAPRLFCSERNIGTRLITEIEVIDREQDSI